jgi:hypothetical protein
MTVICPRATLAVVLVWALSAAIAGCGRIGYGDLASGPDGQALSGLGGAAGGSPAGSAGSSGQGGGGASSTGVGGAIGAGGATGAGGAIGSGGAGVDGGPPASCSQASTPTRAWSFDADLQSWELSGPGTMAWTGAAGDPALGSLQVDWVSGTLTHPRLVQSLGDLSGRILTAEVWLDSGAGATAKLFAQTGTRSVWADGGVVTPTVGRWTCLALDLDNPVFSHQQYDPTQVAIVGFELDCPGTCRVYLDQVAY